MRFEGKSVLVTGAASGIGLVTARQFAREGASVALVDLNLDRLESVRASLQSEGGRVEVFRCDVSNADDVEVAAAGAVKAFGRLDVLVNNAGLMVFKSIEDHTPEDWTKVLGVDLVGAFLFTRQAFLRMNNGGAIVNVSSVHAVETTPFVASYAAAKAAVLSLTRSAAIEGKEKGIRVNAVLPGAIDTPMLWENPNIKAGLEVIKHSDVGKPEDVAEAIVYLASNEANFVQGAALRIDGGRLARL